MTTPTRGYGSGRLVPDLDLCPTIWCPRDDCSGYCGGDGSSWWCERCGTTWDSNGENGEVSS